MKSLPPIKVSSAVRWREFRHRFLPLIVVLAAIGVIGLIWMNRGPRATMTGIGEGVQSIVAAPQTVRVQEWLVEPYTTVAAGTPLVVVIPADSRTDFDLLRSQFEMARLRSQPSLAQDNAMNFERIRVELLKTKAELAIARVKLEQADRDVARNAPLYRDKLVSADIYELSVNTRDALKAEVVEKGKAAAEIEHRLEQLRSIGEPDELRDTAAGRKSLVQLEQAQAGVAKNLEPLVLVAPISGMVGPRQRQVGEYVQPGEPLLALNSTRSERVVAYLRQPYPLEPQVGMAVQITTRTYQRQTFLSQVVQVGAQLEVLTNALALLRPGGMVDAGLPIIVPVPHEINIRPGEIVDVYVTKIAEQILPPRPQL